MSLTLLPIQAPRIHTASPSHAIRISLGRGSQSVGLIFLEFTTVLLCFFVPISIISVFSMLNLAPDTSHHSSRTRYMWSSLLSLFKKRFISSANSLILIELLVPGIIIPLMLGSALIRHASSSMARLNRGQDKGSPCHTPHLTRKGSLSTLFIATLVWAFWYSALIMLMKGGGRLKASRVFHR